MNRKFLLSFLFVLCVVCEAYAQVPADVHLKILKAEDARSYDAELERLISGNSPGPVLLRAMLAAGRIGDERAVPALARRLNSNSPQVAAMAAFALGEIESITAADAILGALNLPAGNAPVEGFSSPVSGSSFAGSTRGTRNQKPETRIARLVEAAGKIAAANVKHEKAKELGRAIISVLDAEMDKAPDLRNREVALLGLTALLRARPEGTDATAARFLMYGDGRVRADAANTLARVRAKNANLVLRKQLQGDPDANARANAARALGAAEDKEAFDLLLDAAVNGDDARVRVSAIRALASLKDARAADKLLERGEALLAAMAKTRKPNFVPTEQSEFLEISTALGTILAKTGNARAIALFRDFARADNFNTAEPYIARVRVGGIRLGMGLGDDAPPPTERRQFVTLVQTIGELAAYEPESAEARKFKDEAPEQIRRLTVAFLNADPKAEPEALLAAPDALRAFAKFKTDDLTAVLRDALKNKDVFVRAAAAELIAELPASPDNISALNASLTYSRENDVVSNDAILAILDALIKLDPKGEGWAENMGLSIISPDHLVRRKVRDVLPEEIRKVTSRQLLYEVTPYFGKGTKNGQVLNADADYRRAISRKNGSVRAVFTTRKGTFTIELLPEDAPLTVDNFVKLARSGYFNGLEVHRVVPNFVMQDGDPIGNGSGGPGWSIRCEINMVPYERGAVGMALSGKDTGGSQWFVTHSPQPHLDGGYTVFGRVSERDMAVVDQIVRGDKIVSVRVVETASLKRGPVRK